MPSPIESSADIPQIRYPWENKKEEPRQLQMAEEYEDVEEQKKIENRSFDSNTPIKFNKEVPVAEKDISTVETQEEPVAIKIEATPDSNQQEDKTLLLEDDKEETKMIDEGEDQPEDIVPVNVDSELTEAKPQVLDMTAQESNAEKVTEVKINLADKKESSEKSAESDQLREETDKKAFSDEESAQEVKISFAPAEKENIETSVEPKEISESTSETEIEVEEEPRIDAQTKERLEFLAQEILDRWEEYKTEPGREKIVNIDFEEISEMTAEEKDSLLQDFQSAFRSFLFHLTIEEEKEKLGFPKADAENQVLENQNPDSREFIDGQLRSLVFDASNRETLKQFIFDIMENLRFKNFEEKYNAEKTQTYSIESDKLKNISRDELGQLMLEMAKDYISESIPDESELSKIYEDKFGSHLKNCDLFDLEILLKENAVIAQMAKEKGIQNIITLTTAFEKFLGAKKTEKDNKVREYLKKRLESKDINTESEKS